MTESDVFTEGRRVNAPHGRVFVRDMPGADTPIVLMHGFPDDHRIYDKLLPWLSPRRAVAFDFLGYGRSDRADPVRFGPDEHLAELEAVLDELDIARAVVVGHDLSGPDAVAFAVTHPQRVAHLVLLNTILGRLPSLRMPEMTRLLADPAFTALADAMVNDEGQRLWLLQYAAARWGGLGGLDPDGLAVRSILPQFFGDTDQPDALAAIRAWTADVFDALDRQDALIASGALQLLAVPVSVIFGETDQYLNPSLAAEIVRLFKNASLHVMSNGSHYPQQDQPELLAELLKDATTHW
jgi:pimeloyl-ACP methyl ester carboxylesterase